MSDPVPVSSKPAGDADEAKKSAKSPVAINALSIKMAGAIRPYLDKAAPALVMLTTALGLAEPYVVALWAYLQYVWEKLQPYHPEELFPALAGFVLVPFALWNKTSFLAERVLGNVISSGIKAVSYTHLTLPTIYSV